MKAQGQHDAAAYHVRQMSSAHLVLAIIVVLGIGVIIAMKPPRTAILICLIFGANLLMWIYFDGPALSVTVWQGTLEINNVLRRYLIPRGRVVSIEVIDVLAINVRVEGGKSIEVSALSPSTYRWKKPSPEELSAHVKSLGDALWATPAPADIRMVETRYRWAHLLGAGIGAIGLGVAFLFSRQL